MEQGPNRFGLLAFLAWNHEWNHYAFDDSILPKAVDQIRQLGVDFIRIDFYWFDIYKPGHPNDFSKYDRIVSLLEKSKIKVLGILHYNKIYHQDGKEVWNAPPESSAEFSTYCADTIRRYAHWVTHWEIWNEPNHEIYWSGPKDQLKAYTELLKAAYTAGKKANPNCQILHGGFSHPIIEAVENLYANGGKSYFDALNFHPFFNPLSPTAEVELETLINSARNIMKKNGDDQKKIWITEIGCPGIPNGDKRVDWFGGKGTNETEQANWLDTIYRITGKFSFVEKVFWAFYRDTGNMFNEATDYFGLVREDLTPKPAYERMKKLIENKNLVSKLTP